MYLSQRICHTSTTGVQGLNKIVLLVVTFGLTTCRTCDTFLQKIGDECARMQRTSS